MDTSRDNPTSGMPEVPAHSCGTVSLKDVPRLAFNLSALAGGSAS